MAEIRVRQQSAQILGDIVSAYLEAKRNSAENKARDQVPVLEMPLILHVEKDNPPTLEDALECAARATLKIAVDERANADWAEAFNEWLSGQFRKVVRRARAKKWEDAQTVPGVTFKVRSAEIRVCPPYPSGELPRELSRLQVSGTELEPSNESTNNDDWPTILVSPVTEMSSGKMMAQVGHAAMMYRMLLQERSVDLAAEWSDVDFPVNVRVASMEEWEDLSIEAPVQVRDAGFTEVDPNTLTAVAVPGERF